jgi:hypothetical protein
MNNDEVLAWASHYLARARHALAPFARDPAGAEILRHIVEAEDALSAARGNASTLLTELEDHEPIQVDEARRRWATQAAWVARASVRRAGWRPAPRTISSAMAPRSRASLFRRAKSCWARDSLTAAGFSSTTS